MFIGGDFYGILHNHNTILFRQIRQLFVFLLNEPELLTLYFVKNRVLQTIKKVVVL